MSSENLTRKQILAGLVMLPALAAALSAGAQAGMSKKDAKYQDSPKDNHSCSGCSYYKKNTETTGSCPIVAGEISAKGWCQYWNEK